MYAVIPYSTNDCKREKQRKYIFSENKHAVGMLLSKPALADMSISTCIFTCSCLDNKVDVRMHSSKVGPRLQDFKVDLNVARDHISDSS